MTRNRPARHARVRRLCRHINPTVPPRNWAFNIRTSYGKCIHPYGGTGTTDNLGLVLYEVSSMAGCTQSV